jgi:archaeal flagellin FlaB
MNSLKHNDEGFTGLEAAIVLIAFVVVAAVFSYVVLGAGFFTTQKAQETVHTGVSQTTSAVEPSGPVSVYTGDGSTVGNITFYLQLAAGGTGVDMSKVTYTVSTPKQVSTFTNYQVNYTWVKENTVGGSNHATHAGLLNSREMVYVDINPAFAAAQMGINDKFIVEVKPPIGAALPIARTLPAGFTAGKWYEVF